MRRRVWIAIGFTAAYWLATGLAARAVYAATAGRYLGLGSGPDSLAAIAAARRLSHELAYDAALGAAVTALGIALQVYLCLALIVWLLWTRQRRRGS